MGNREGDKEPEEKLKYFFLEREGIKECLYATGNEKLQRKRHVSERENLLEKGS